ncbi:MAG: alpha-galactosidase [Planctomycetes bacterium]|nr:alpha-galactosidase [Planctomycetota bacterium]
MILLALLALLQEEAPLRVQTDAFGRVTLLRGDEAVVQDLELFAGARNWPGGPWQNPATLGYPEAPGQEETNLHLMRPPVREVRKTERGVNIRFGRGFEMTLEPSPDRPSCVVRLGLKPEREMDLEVLKLVCRTQTNGIALVNGQQSWCPKLPVSPESEHIVSRSMLLWGTERGAQLIGFLRHRFGLNTLILNPSGHLEIISRFGRFAVNRPLEFDPIEIGWSHDPHALQQEYLRRVLAHLPEPAPTFRPETAPVSWSSWPHFKDRVQEDHILRNAEFIAKHLPHVRFIHLDDGYQRALGDWDTNSKFPHGHRWLTDRIRALGLKPSLWIAPFQVSQNSELFASHPEWLLRDGNEPLPMGELPGAGKVYYLDPSHPEVREWLENLARRVVQEWGYEALSLDSIFRVFAARGFHAAVTPVEAYVLGVKAIRQGAGDAILLGCGAPLYESIGLVDGMYTGRERSELGAISGGITSRYAFHGRTWWDYPEELLVNASASPEDARMAMSLLCALGLPITLGDDLPQLGPDRLNLIARMMPPAPAKRIRPLDLFDRTPRHTPLVRVGRDSIALEGPWRFKKGDDPAWAHPDLDDSGWSVTRVPQYWDGAYDGYGWYRTRFRASPGEGTLELGKLEDRDETYLNGKKIGTTSDAAAFRAYPVTVQEENVLAIRVYDYAGPGGFASVSPDQAVEAWQIQIGDYVLIALFNYGSAPKTHVVPLDAGSCAYETWSGEYRRDVDMIEDTLPPHGARVWVVRKTSRHPQVIANPGHVAGWGPRADWADDTLSGSGEAVIDPAGRAPDRPLERRGPLLYVDGERWSVRFTSTAGSTPK